jgi:hypothetical protein
MVSSASFSKLIPTVIILAIISRKSPRIILVMEEVVEGIKKASCELPVAYW